MNAFRYQAIEGSGSSVSGVIEAEDRKAALSIAGRSRSVSLQPRTGDKWHTGAVLPKPRKLRPKQLLSVLALSARKSPPSPAKWALCSPPPFQFPQALDGLGEEEENPP